MPSPSIAIITIAACSSDDSDESTTAGTVEPTVATTAPPATETPTSLESSPDTPQPTPGTSSIDAVRGVRLTFAVPAGWVNHGWAVVKGNPYFGVVFMAVTNIFVDPCQWVEFDPPIGPSVDDLASAWADVPGLNATAPIDITIDEYHGKQVEFTAPDYNAAECHDGYFGLFQEAGFAGRGPNYVAQGPNQHHQLWILDVDGTRLVISASDFPDTSEQDRTDLNALLSSIRIG